MRRYQAVEPAQRVGRPGQLRRRFEGEARDGLTTRAPRLWQTFAADHAAQLRLTVPFRLASYGAVTAQLPRATTMPAAVEVSPIENPLSSATPGQKTSWHTFGWLALTRSFS
jgi:hypothetical protein